MKVSCLTFVMLLTSVTIVCEIAAPRRFTFVKQNNGAGNDKRRFYESER